MARIYANENFPKPAVERLRQLGHDVETSDDAGNSGLGFSDPDVLAYATQTRRIVLTHNRKHFRALHRTGIAHAGIVICTEDVDFISLADRVHAEVGECETLDDELRSVTRPPQAPLL